MIITPIEQREVWTCLARRGMLLSEVETIEFMHFNIGSTFDFGVNHGVDEFLIILSGSFEILGKVICAGMIVFVPERISTKLRALGDATILSVRSFPDRLTAQLPARVPELPEHERAI